MKANEIDLKDFPNLLTYRDVLWVEGNSIDFGKEWEFKEPVKDWLLEHVQHKYLWSRKDGIIRFGRVRDAIWFKMVWL